MTVKKHSPLWYGDENHAEAFLTRRLDLGEIINEVMVYALWGLAVVLVTVEEVLDLYLSDGCKSEPFVEQEVMDWLHELHGRDPWLPLLVGLVAAATIMTFAALLARITAESHEQKP